MPRPRRLRGSGAAHIEIFSRLATGFRTVFYSDETRGEPFIIWAAKSLLLKKGETPGGDIPENRAHLQTYLFLALLARICRAGLDSLDSFVANVIPRPPLH